MKHRAKKASQGPSIQVDSEGHWSTQEGFAGFAVLVAFAAFAVFAALAVLPAFPAFPACPAFPVHAVAAFVDFFLACVFAVCVVFAGFPQGE